MTFPFMFTETPPGPSSTGISMPSSEKMALSSRHTAGKHSSIRRNRVDGAWFTFTIPECRSRQNAKVSDRRKHFKHLAASGASKEDVSAVLDELASVGKRVELMIRTRPTLPDPNDEMVLETAINGRADAIVTFNDRDFRPVAARFRCSVVRQGAVLRGLAEETE